MKERALQTWKADLRSGVPYPDRDQDRLSYAYGNLPLDIRFIELGEAYKAAEAATAPVPEDKETIYLCVDILKRDNKTPRYTLYSNIQQYNAANGDRDEIEKRALIKISGADVTAFMKEWIQHDNVGTFSDDLKLNNMQDVFDANPPSIVNVAIGAAAGDAIWMSLSIALAKHIKDFRSIEIVTAFVFPALIAPVTAYLTYRWELKDFELKNERAPGLAERRALRKRAIDIGWQVLVGMMGWTAGYYLTLYLLPIVLNAAGWSLTAGGMNLACAVIAGLGQAIFTTMIDYQQQARELKPGEKVDIQRLGCVFVTEFIAGFAWYGMLIVIPALLAEPLSHLAKPAVTAVSMLVVAATVAITTAIANTIVPYITLALRRIDVSNIVTGIQSAFLSSTQALTKPALSAPALIAAPGPA
jgi:hypothetical protein